MGWITHIRSYDTAIGGAFHRNWPYRTVVPCDRLEVVALHLKYRHGADSVTNDKPATLCNQTCDKVVVVPACNLRELGGGVMLDYSIQIDLQVHLRHVVIDPRMKKRNLPRC